MVARELDENHLLSLHNKSSLLNAPVPVTRDGVDPVLKTVAWNIGSLQPCPLKELKRPVLDPGMTLEKAEYATKLVTLYCWLHYRFPHLFPDIQEAQAELADLNEIVTKRLSKMKVRRCPECGTTLAWEHKFPLCDPCHFGR